MQSCFEQLVFNLTLYTVHAVFNRNTQTIIGHDIFQAMVIYVYHELAL
uniref:Uncharacterized protein n=1 Tax=Anguilla anguilla TaxID=7936 RepID=A0A0E9RU41_ANGAN